MSRVGASSACLSWSSYTVKQYEYSTIRNRQLAVQCNRQTASELSTDSECLNLSLLLASSSTRAVCNTRRWLFVAVELWLQRRLTVDGFPRFKSSTACCKIENRTSRPPKKLRDVERHAWRSLQCGKATVTGTFPWNTVMIQSCVVMAVAANWSKTEG